MEGKKRKVEGRRWKGRGKGGIEGKVNPLPNTNSFYGLGEQYGAFGLHYWTTHFKQRLRFKVGRKMTKSFYQIKYAHQGIR